MKFHVVGSNGYIARRLLQRLNPDYTVVSYSRHRCPNTIFLDLANPGDANLSQIRPDDFVVFLAAISSPDECHNHYDYSYQINVTGTAQFIEESLCRGARVLFFSSDVVVGACRASRDESMPVHPIGEYAQMKHLIEQRFLTHASFKVFRLSYVLSREDKFMAFLQKCSRENIVPDVYDALFRNVVYLEDVIDAIIALEKTFSQWKTPIFHICGLELLSRKDLAHIYQAIVDPSLRFTVSIPDSGFFDARPNIIATKSLYFSKLLQRDPTKVSDALKQEFMKV